VRHFFYVKQILNRNGQQFHQYQKSTSDLKQMNTKRPRHKNGSM